MFRESFNGIEIELNLYERRGKWTGEYILIKRAGPFVLNEVNSLSEAGETQEEARQIALCEASRSLNRFLTAAPALLDRIAHAS